MATALHLVGTWLAVVLPHVEDPWPRSVGLGMPFTAAGVGGIFGNVATVGRSAEDQARSTSQWGTRFFWLGMLGYILLLFNQLLSAG
jgi:uncharacterized membrane protein